MPRRRAARLRLARDHGHTPAAGRARAEHLLESGPKEYERVFGGEAVSLGIYRCRQCSPARGGEQTTRTHNLNLPFGGLYVKHVAGREVPIDPCQAVFFNRGEPYRTSHPTGGGDWGAYVSVREDVLLEIVRGSDPAAEERPERPFRRTDGPLPARDLVVAHRLGAQAVAGEPQDPLEVEETLLHLVSSVVAAAERRPIPAREPPRAHRDLARDVRAHLAVRYREGWTLDSIAATADVSPFHLCRVFKQVTGETLHRHLQRVRLRAALGRLRDPDVDLLGLALELGFSSHSHFTARFREEFGATPSAVRDRGI